MCVCRLLQEQMEKSLSDVQHRLSVKASELHAAHQQMDKLEERIGKSLLFFIFTCLSLFHSLCYGLLQI